MERQKKPWDEMTEEERQVIRESWKHTLPEEFDVFCIGNFVPNRNVEIPGNLYVSRNFHSDICQLTIRDSLIIDGYLLMCNCDVTVYNGPCICGSDVSAGRISIFNGDFISDGDISVNALTIHNGDCIVKDTIANFGNDFNVNNGTLDCYDIYYFGRREIHASDFVCRHYEEENK